MIWIGLWGRIKPMSMSWWTGWWCGLKVSIAARNSTVSGGPMRKESAKMGRWKSSLWSRTNQNTMGTTSLNLRARSIPSKRMVTGRTFLWLRRLSSRQESSCPQIPCQRALQSARSSYRPTKRSPTSRNFRRKMRMKKTRKILFTKIWMRS